MAFDIASIDGSINAGRESVLGWINRVPDSTQLKLGFLVFAAVMAIILMRQFSQGQEERKGMYGTLAIVLLCISFVFGFRVMLVAWIVLFILGLELAKKLKQADSKGAGMIVIVMCVLAYILSVNILMMITIVGGVLALGWAAKHAESAKAFGTPEARRLTSEMGIPEKKERPIIKALRRIASKGAGWSKDKLVRGLGKIKQRMALREATNLETQQREAEIGAGAEKFAKTLIEYEEQEANLEKTDSRYISEILRLCEELKNYVSRVKDDQVAAEKKNIAAKSKEIIKLSNSLIEDKAEEEKITEKANKTFLLCMRVIQRAAKEAKQLEESKSAFRELQKTTDSSINALKSNLGETLKELAKAIDEASKSKTDAAKQRREMLVQRRDALIAVEKKLGEVKQTVDNVLLRLKNINAREDQRIQAINAINAKAKAHKGKLHTFTNEFKQQDQKLKQDHKEFKKLFSRVDQEISDEEMSALADSLIPIFDHLTELAKLLEKYNREQLAPMVNEMAKVMRTVFSISEVAEYINKMYYWLSKAMEELDKMAATVDPDPAAKRELQKDIRVTELEEKLELRAYKKGKFIESHIRQSYDILRKANEQVQNHTRVLQEYAEDVAVTRTEVAHTLNTAFKKILNRELTQAKKMLSEADLAAHDAAKARVAERRAKAYL
jgi:DNA repair exonuclease SbcCD ATPase subunit